MKALFTSLALGFLLSVGTGTAYAQEQSKPAPQSAAVTPAPETIDELPDEKKLVTACNQAAIELEHRRTENTLLEEKVTKLEVAVTKQTEQNQLLLEQNSQLLRALSERKVTDERLLEALDLQRKEIFELKDMYARARASEKRQRKLKWVLAIAAGVGGLLIR
jgi:hypothetical protein